MKDTTIQRLEEMNACGEAVVWARGFPNAQAAWDACERGDWMLWIVGKLAGGSTSKSRKKVVLCACKCARLALKYVPKDEKRPRKAIETAEAWANGMDGITLGDVRDAAYAADAYAAYAADAYAAYAADAAAYAAAYAAYATYAAYAATYAAYAAYARTKTLKRCANIVRESYPKAPRLKS